MDVGWGAPSPRSSRIVLSTVLQHFGLLSYLRPHLGSRRLAKKYFFSAFLAFFFFPRLVCFVLSIWFVYHQTRCFFYRRVVFWASWYVVVPERWPGNMAGGAVRCLVFRRGGVSCAFWMCMCVVFCFFAVFVETSTRVFLCWSWIWLNDLFMYLHKTTTNIHSKKAVARGIRCCMLLVAVGYLLWVWCVWWGFDVLCPLDVES